MEKMVGKMGKSGASSLCYVAINAATSRAAPASSSCPSDVGVLSTQSSLSAFGLGSHSSSVRGVLSEWEGGRRKRSSVRKSAVEIGQLRVPPHTQT